MLAQQQAVVGALATLEEARASALARLAPAPRSVSPTRRRLEQAEHDGRGKWLSERYAASA
jgi:hypothetical protein